MNFWFKEKRKIQCKHLKFKLYFSETETNINTIDTGYLNWTRTSIFAKEQNRLLVKYCFPLAPKFQNPLLSYVQTSHRAILLPLSVLFTSVPDFLFKHLAREAQCGVILKTLKPHATTTYYNPFRRPTDRPFAIAFHDKDLTIHAIKLHIIKPRDLYLLAFAALFALSLSTI